jgi:K+-sensing histidine kinase KdpD
MLDLQKKISHIISIPRLNKIIQEDVASLFKTKSAYILFFDKKNNREIHLFFDKKNNRELLINDAVFLEDNLSETNISKINKELNYTMHLLLPLYNSKNICIAVLVLWGKFFWDFYTKDEINVLKTFTFFLELHLRYMRTYSDMIELSKSLDIKVDQKTIEYNNLINKQKEFISMISHEIRSPIGSTIFQVDSIVSEIDQSKLSLADIRKNICDIWDQLVNVWELLKKLFSIQYFDTRNVVLLKEKVAIWNLLEKEFDIYSRMYEKISFIKNISAKIGFISIDKIHLHQVITNLLENAIKFANPTDPVVLVECYLKWNILIINIEDNWKWYWDIDASVIFEKYSKWQHTSLWLWLWLYLCKRIITMHEWSITLQQGMKLKWASFLIELPI